MTKGGNVKLHFLGAAQNVTGSRYLLENGKSRILIDCGLYQERDFKERNWNPFPVEPSSIEAIVLTHAHLDHSGFIPRLVKLGFRGKIYSTPATAEVTKIALLDSAHLQEEDAMYKKKRHEREGRKGPYPEVPLYTTEDVKTCLPLFEGVPYRKPFEAQPGLKVTFHDAGHILGSAMVSVEIGSSPLRRIIFSGDIGRWGKPILKDPTLFDEADYVVTESTYGNRLHEDPADIESLVADVINTTKQAGGNIVIPSFAIERAQEVLYTLNNLLMDNRIPNLIVFLDSPMAIRVTEVFRRFPDLYDKEMTELVTSGHSPFRFPSLKMATSVEDSKAINYIRGSIIVIAGSGMCTGGRIKHHLVNNIERPECTILFVGYQAKGTLGRELVDGRGQVRILGEQRRVRAKIVQIQGFSGHADRKELFKWISHLKHAPKHVFITHGESEQSEAHAEHIRSELGWECTTPSYGDVVDLI